MLQTLQLLHIAILSSSHTNISSILLPFSFLQQLTTNGFQVTPILVVLLFCTVLNHKLLKMLFFLFHAFFLLSYITSSSYPQEGLLTGFEGVFCYSC